MQTFIIRGHYIIHANSLEEAVETLIEYVGRENWPQPWIDALRRDVFQYGDWMWIRQDVKVQELEQED